MITELASSGLYQGSSLCVIFIEQMQPLEDEKSAVHLLIT